jgi:uncharacterized membrane protein YphA (DoxX/SURF4 family)
VRRIRRATAWLLGLYLAHLFITLGWVKFDPDGFFSAAFRRWGLPPWLRVAVGALEVVGGVLLLPPWTATPAALLLACVMIVAWITRYLDGRMLDVAWISAYLLGLLWIAHEWRGHAFWGALRSRIQASDTTRPAS